LSLSSKEVGFERDYRLYYYQLSAQLHADPEDLINELMASASQNVEKLAVETVAFSWMLTKAALGFYLRALAEFSTRLCSGGSVDAIEANRGELESLAIV
jgi:hypothetical protein